MSEASGLLRPFSVLMPLPIFPGKRYLDWDLEDPAGKDTATVRRIRDQIDARVRSLLTELLPDAQEPIPSSPAAGR
jgi:protein-tyrosine-phosphatase